MPNAKCPDTLWSIVVRAMHDTPDGRAALAALCKAYWFPVYAFIRRRSPSPDDALDRTQEFFARLLERNDLAKVERRSGGKFRSWLLKCVVNYLANEHKHAHAGIRIPPELIRNVSDGSAEDRYQEEPAEHLTPERLYERHFALTLLARVFEQLRSKYAAAGREPLFEALKGCVSGDAAQRSYKEVAEALGMTETAIKKAAFDLRDRYKDFIRAEVASLVDVEGPGGEAVVEAELEQLLEALGDEPA